METSNILFRCSKLGELMTEPRSKTETLSETTKTYLQEVFINQKYGRKKDIVNKYIEKGLAVEEDSITLFSRVTKELFFKNEKHLKNDFICGTPDLLSSDGSTVIDIKSSWDIFTFFKSGLSEVNKAYYWQLQGYMWLTGAKNAKLAYCLVNTPQPLISDQKRSFMWKAQIIDENELTEKAFAEIEKNAIYDDIPMSERVIIQSIEYSQEDIDRLGDRIIQCREYMKTHF